AQNFPTRDGWIVIFCNKDKFWQALAERMELPTLLQDPRFAGFPERLAHKTELVKILKARFAMKTTADWLGLLRGHVPCAPVNPVGEALEDGQGRAREMVIEGGPPPFGRNPEVASPNRPEGGIRWPAAGPSPGGPTEAFLSGGLGYG